MPGRKRIQPDETVGLQLTDAERALVLDELLYLDPELEEALREVRPGQPVLLTLDALDLLGGCVAAEANHTRNKKLQKRLDGIFRKIQHILDAHADDDSAPTLSFELAREAQSLIDGYPQMRDSLARILAAVKGQRLTRQRLDGFWVSPAQREFLSIFSGNSAAIKKKLTRDDTSLTVAEVASLASKLVERGADGETEQRVIFLIVAEHLLDHLNRFVGSPRQTNDRKRKVRRATTATHMIYQFKITLQESQPPIWRRIQVGDCTLDTLHEHIQTAMGWTNSHLHQFEIEGQRYGDPQLMDDGFDDFGNYIDSTRTLISEFIPEDGKRFAFRYEYDFGDGWEHEILFEGCPQRDPRQKYPLCLEGARACPPEDVGGIGGYEEFVEAVADPEHERHHEFREWSGPFDPDAFNAADLTKAMKKGLPNWRE